MSKKKNVGVLFSGGLDSTYLAYLNLKYGNNVTLLNIKLDNNKHQTEAESKSILKIHNYFLDMCHNEHNNCFLIDGIANINFSMKAGINMELPQPILWTTLIHGCDLTKLDELHIGYIMNDDAISYLSDIKKLFKATKPFVKSIPKLKFPLIKTSKEEILYLLPDELIKSTNSCEEPNIEDGVITYCGYCHTCKKFKKENYYNNSILRKRFINEDDEFKAFDIQPKRSISLKEDILSKEELTREKNDD